MHQRSLVLLAVAILLASPLAVPGSAQGADESEGSQAGDEARGVEVETSEDGVRLWLEPDGEPLLIELDATTAGTRLTFPADRQDPGRSDVEVLPQTLLEYRDSDDDGAYQRGEPVASGWRLTSTSPRENQTSNDTTPWSSPIVTNVTREDAQGKRLLLPIPLGTNGTLFLELEAFAEPVRVDDQDLGPTSARLELAIQGYPFEAEGTDLALTFAVRNRASGEIVRGHPSLAEDQLGLSVEKSAEGRTVDFVVAWQNTSTVDGDSAPVSLTSLEGTTEGEGEGAGDGDRRTGEDEANRSPRQGGGPSTVTEERFVLSYARGQRVVHEGKAEISSAEENGLHAWPAGLAVFATAAASLAARRRPGA